MSRLDQKVKLTIQFNSDHSSSSDDESKQRNKITKVKDSPLIKHVTSPEEITWSSYRRIKIRAINNLLYKNRKIYTRFENGLSVNLVIPNSLMIKCFKAIHSSSHDGVYHTLFKFKLDYYNPHEEV